MLFMIVGKLVKTELTVKTGVQTRHNENSILPNVWMAASFNVQAYMLTVHKEEGMILKTHVDKHVLRTIEMKEHATLSVMI